MPTIISHPAVVVAATPWFRTVPRSAVVAAAICSALPDIDVLGFRFGIPYSAPLGHRGATHSLLFAAIVAAIATAAYRHRREVPRTILFAFFFLVTASHGLLDALTNGGRGVGLLIPFSLRRFFFGFRPIRVSPIGVGPFAQRAALVLSSEVRWIWAPSLALAVIGWTYTHRRRPLRERAN